MSATRLALTAVVFVLGLGLTPSASAHDSGDGNAFMWRACDGRQLDDACAFQNAEHDLYRGSCQLMSNVLVCVRNQPIERAAMQLEISRAGGGAHPQRWWQWLATAGMFALGGVALVWFNRKNGAEGHRDGSQAKSS